MKKLRDFVIKFLATGCGVGLSTKAPGTLGTLVALPIFWYFTYRQNIQTLLFIFFFSLAACLIAEFAGPLLGETDSPHIVIDEIAGFLVTMVWLPRTWQAVLGGFLLFRLFDIWKPGPIGYLEKRIPGGIGVVVDDLLAGIFANIILQIIYNQTNLLGARLL